MIKHPNMQEQELLEITEIGFDPYKDELRNKIKSIEISSNEDMEHTIDQAQKENWKALSFNINNQVKIPEKIGELTNLEYLSIDVILGAEVMGIDIPKEIGKLENLETFSAYSCNIKALPPEFANLKKLKRINLNDNAFDVFPEEILALENLESLAINWNFTSVPDELCELKNLKYLYMPMANLTSLPENIGKLDKLEVLCIWGTEISVLPESCKNLTNIKSIYLTKSIFQQILPPEIAAQSPKEAIRYILKYQVEQNRVKVNESKMIIVGQGGVGKTCLLNRLVNNQYEDMVSTEGIDIKSWNFTQDQEEYTLNVWDFGGQEIYHATHQFFLTNRSLYVFVWDARQEEEYGRIDYWLHTIESFADKCPIIIVVNKCDSRVSIRQLDLKSIKSKFPQIVDSYKVSCKEDIGIDELRNVIKLETSKLPLMGMVWLSSWLDVRMRLEVLSKEKNLISYDEYLKICAEHSISKMEALSLIKYLHDLGIVINFHGDAILKNIVILRPEWGTNAVYKILDAQDTILKGRNGILKYDDLSIIWNDSTEYPDAVYSIILRLMENFQLSFEIVKSREYLIAELLNNEEITIHKKTNYKNVLTFQYAYDFLPAGIMTRFIVKANTYIVEENGRKMCWKKGVYLEHKDSIAIVKLDDDISERKIDIKITGRNARENREFLAIIRNYFDEIHNGIPKLKFTEYVKCNCNKTCDYLHDYRYLLQLDERGISQERCKKSFKMVSVSKLLDGVDRDRKKEYPGKMNSINISVNPTFMNDGSVTNHNDNHNTNLIRNKITVEIKNNINELQGSINELRDEIVSDSPELAADLDKALLAMDKIEGCSTKEDIVKTGALNKVKRFLMDLQDEDSNLGKVIGGIKHGAGIVQDIAEKYNSVAEWCGLPVVPKVFLKKQE